MQAWNQVKVINKDSQFNGRAGMVVRVEKQGDTELNEVKLDATPDEPEVVEQFADTELQLLG